jgi:hypothetical protein
MLRIVALITFILSLISFIVYFQFNRVVAGLYPDQDQFTSFVGTFNGIMSVIIIIYQLLVTARVISYLGLIRTLFIHPLLLSIPVVAGSVQSVSATPVMVAHFVNNFGERTFSEAAFESMYGAVPDRHREQAMSFMKIIIKPVSIGVTGLSLYAMFHFFPGETTMIIALILPFLFILWSCLIWKLKGLYMETLFGNFVKEEATEQLTSYQAITNLPNSETLKILRKAFKIGSNKAKKFAIELAGEMNLVLLKEEIYEFLNHEDEDLKIEAIKAVGKLKSPDAYSNLIKIYNQQSMETKILILESLKNLEPEKFHINIPLMIAEEKDPLLCGVLMEYMWEKSSILLDDADFFRELVKAKSALVRKQAARCIRYDKDKKFIDEFIELLNDRERDVVMEAIHTAGKTMFEETIPYLIRHLQNPDRLAADLAMKTLIETGLKKDISGHLRRSINIEEPQEILDKKLIILASSGKTADLEFIVGMLDKIPLETASLILAELVDKFPESGKLSQKTINILEKILFDTRNSTIKELISINSLGQIIGRDNESYRILALLLKDRVDARRKMILSGLHLMFPSKHMKIIKENIYSSDWRNRNIALEALENIIPAGYRKEIIPLFEKDTFDEEIEYISELYTRKNPELAQIIEDFNKSENDWLVAWSYYTAGFLKLKDWKNKLESALSSINPFISEHARKGLVLMGETVTSGAVTFLTVSETEKEQDEKDNADLIKNVKTEKAGASEIEQTEKKEEIPAKVPKTGKWKNKRNTTVAEVTGADENKTVTSKSKVKNKKNDK